MCSFCPSYLYPAKNKEWHFTLAQNGLWANHSHERLDICFSYLSWTVTGRKHLGGKINTTSDKCLWRLSNVVKYSSFTAHAYSTVYICHFDPLVLIVIDFGLLPLTKVEFVWHRVAFTSTQSKAWLTHIKVNTTQYWDQYHRWEVLLMLNQD